MAYIGFQRDKKEGIQEYIDLGITLYRSRFGRPATEVMLSEGDMAQVGSEYCGLPVRTAQYIRPYVIWVGEAEKVEAFGKGEKGEKFGG